MTGILYRVGDATSPFPVDANKKVIIVHCCNDIGAWGAGFVLAISKRWSLPEQEYRRGIKQGVLSLGSIQSVPVEENVTVVNLIGQKGVGLRGKGRPPIRYDAIDEGLHTVGRLFSEFSYEVHLPRLGAGLAGGDWCIIERLLTLNLVNKGFTVVVYDLPEVKNVQD